MQPGDNLFIYTIDHGDTLKSTGERILYLWDKTYITATEFGQQVDKIDSNCTINIVMGQCFAGGFASALNKKNRVLSFAAQHDELSYPLPNLQYDAFVYAITCALNGYDMSGNPISADIDGDNRITMYEAFEYAKQNDNMSEHPFQVSNNKNLKYILTLCNAFCHNNETFLPQEITSNMTLTSDYYGYGEIVVKSGATRK